MAFVYTTDTDMAHDLTGHLPVLTSKTEALRALAKEHDSGGWTPARLAAYRRARRENE